MVADSMNIDNEVRRQGLGEFAFQKCDHDQGSL